MNPHGFRKRWTVLLLLITSAAVFPLQLGAGDKGLICSLKETPMGFLKGHGFTKEEFAQRREGSWGKSLTVSPSSSVATCPGLFEFQLAAVAKFIFEREGAQGIAFHPIVASGENTLRLHYTANNRRLKEGDIVLMDFAPDAGARQKAVSDTSDMVLSERGVP